MNDNKKMNYALDNLLSRQDYLVTQANDLARSLGNLSTFEHKILDYCFSFVQKDDTPETVYKVTAIEMIKHLGLNTSGDSYARIVAGFNELYASTAIYLGSIRSDGLKAITMTSLFDYITSIEDGRIEFRFSSQVAPYVFQLKERFYSFHLSELSRVRSKYTLTLLKLWNAKSLGQWRKQNDPRSTPPAAMIEGSLNDWEAWFLGSGKNGKPIHWPAGRFKKDCLTVALKEIEHLYPTINTTLTQFTMGRRVNGYRIEFTPMLIN